MRGDSHVVWQCTLYKFPKLPSADAGESHPNGRHLDPTNDDIIALI